MAFFHTSATAVCFSWQPQIILALRLFRFCDCQWYDKRPSLRIARKIGSLRELSTDQMHHSASFLRRNSNCWAFYRFATVLSHNPRSWQKIFAAKSPWDNLTSLFTIANLVEIKQTSKEKEPLIGSHAECNAMTAR